MMSKPRPTDERSGPAAIDSGAVMAAEDAAPKERKPTIDDFKAGIKYATQLDKLDVREADLIASARARIAVERGRLKASMPEYVRQLNRIGADDPDIAAWNAAGCPARRTKKGGG